MSRVIYYSEADLVDYSPVTALHVSSGMTLGAVAEAAVREGDNTAGNLLFRTLGGPQGLERQLRQIGDTETTCERVETDLNSAIPTDRRDTSTALALASDLTALLLSQAMRAAGAAQLKLWMSGNTSGETLIRAGLPDAWTVADKSGAGSCGTRNDIGVIERPDGKPISLSVLSTRATREAVYDDSLTAEATHLALSRFVGS